MALEKRTLRELNTCSVMKPYSSCITLPAPAQGRTADFKLRKALLDHFPTFYGLSTEDPIMHLKEFQMVCTSLAPHGADENILMLKVFPFSLADEAKHWFHYLLPSGVITSWDAMVKTFLEKYSPTSRVVLLKKKLSGIQLQGASIHAYYERCKSLIDQCPQHQIDGKLLVQYFYEGLAYPLEDQIAKLLIMEEVSNF